MTTGKLVVVLLLLLLMTTTTTEPDEDDRRQRRKVSRAGRGDAVDLDLDAGVVRGYSRYVTFLVPPVVKHAHHNYNSHGQNHQRCSRHAVVRIDFSGPYRLARVVLDYDRPRLWTLDIGDSATADGHGGDTTNATSNAAEVHVFNRQLRVYSNSLPGYRSATIDGGYLLKVVDNVVRKRSRLTLQISNERVTWTVGKQKDELDSRFLFTLAGQQPTHGTADHFVYAAFNRVIAGDWRNGTGLCRAAIHLLKEEDTDECRVRNGNCVHRCHNQRGNYTCSCHSGFQLDQDKHNCVDINECLYRRGDCAHQCVNTLGSYECRCNEGYTIDSDGRNCNVGSWCREQGCAHSCEITRTSYLCTCRPGYILGPDNKSCMQTCALGNGGCQHRCTNTADGPICTCHYKYILGLDKKSCSPSCSVNNGGCDRRCSVTPQGVVKCSCPNGLLLHKDGKTCLDIDECSENSGGCSFQCQNNIGSYECICPQGYKLLPDEKTCEEFDECSINDTCDAMATCVNLPGSFRCECYAGYDKYGVTHCGDHNECDVSNGGCQHTCVNTPGSYYCTCREGFHLHPNSKDCVELNHCRVGDWQMNAMVTCARDGTESGEVCGVQCNSAGSAVSTRNDSFVFTCGTKDTDSRTCTETGTGIPCADAYDQPLIRRRVRYLFTSDKCQLRKFSSLISGETPMMCLYLGQLTYTSIECTPRLRHRRKHRGAGAKTTSSIIKVEMEFQFSYDKITDKCDVYCSRRNTIRRIKRSLTQIRAMILNDNFFFTNDGVEYRISHTLSPLSGATPTCGSDEFYFNDRCVSCSTGTYYDLEHAQCLSCSRGTYQDERSQLGCKLCPIDAAEMIIMNVGAQNLSQCGGQCPPGHYSPDGFQPCLTCELGTFQPEPGRSFCHVCGTGIMTQSTASTSFQSCEVNQLCLPGYYFDTSQVECTACPKGTYQPDSGQNFCISCPGETVTEKMGATSLSACKSTKCGGYIGKLLGIFESPNFPGEYPNHAECTWVIRPQKGRRILVVVPEVFLANDKCGDYLVMRKSRSPYSVTTYETCKTQDRPIAFTARSRKLWIRFKSDGQNAGHGFRIPYALFNEEYQPLIESIVRDSQLYAMINHQEILKDRKLLTALMDVIAHPINYYKYANISRAWFPDSFIRFIMSKVKVFFS